jgi:aminoglycoside phosphotransferase family enzyme/predicted kinase
MAFDQLRADVAGAARRLRKKPMNHVVESQEPVFAFLADPAAHRGESVTRVDTHAAVLFLGRQRVLKVKRAVRFPFLDFSTVAKRKAACEAELEVNRPYAPGIYRRVVPITRDADGRLTLDGRGTPIEWAVEMARFDETRTLDHLADAERIDAALAEALGRTVAEAHARARPVEPAPWIAAIFAYIDEHATAFAENPDVFPAVDVAALARDGRDAHQRIHSLLVERGQRGLIRRIHGDLHLGNIVLMNEQPVLFDAIEFSPLIASGDVLYDLAFLLMDLVERGLGVPANIVFNRYLLCTQRAEDLDALAALPFFLSMRAAIRAKVTAARLEQAEAEKQPEIRRNARKYFGRARRFLEPAPPMLIAVGGLSGTGKSVLARALAPRLAPQPGAVVLRTDVERKVLFGKAETESLPREAYDLAVTERVYDSIVEKARKVIATGHSAIVDAVFAKPQERAAVERAAAALNVPFQGLFLEAALETRIDRVGTRGRDASDADATIAQAQESYELGNLTWPRVDASGTPAETLVRAEAVATGIPPSRE